MHVHFGNSSFNGSLSLPTQAVQKAVGKPASGGGGTKRARAPDDEDEEEDGAAAARPEGAAVKKKPMGRPPKVWKCVRPLSASSSIVQ